MHQQIQRQPNTIWGAVARTLRISFVTQFEQMQLGQSCKPWLAKAANWSWIKMYGLEKKSDSFPFRLSCPKGDS